MKFAVIIPFRPASQSADWDNECKILNQTLHSLLQQTYPHISIYVIYTDAPALGNLDERVSMISFPFPFLSFQEIPHHEQLLQQFGSEKLVVRRWDKGRKLSYGAKIAKEKGADYIMAFDSDDLLSRYFFERLAEEAVKSDSPGWYVEKGFFYRQGNRSLIRIPRSMRTINGSTHVLRSDLVRIPNFHSTDWLDFNLFTDHGWIKDRMYEEYGVRLKAVSFPAVVYVIHDSNISKVNREFHWNMKSIVKRIIRGVPLTTSIRYEFFLNPLPEMDTPFFSFRWLSLKRLNVILQFIREHPFAKHRQGFYYCRFFAWQLQQRLFPHDLTVAFTSKTKLVLRRHLIWATGNYYTGLQDFPEMGFLLHLLRPDDVFADIGANVGTYTVLASGHVGARSLCFEPVPSTVTYLQKNLQVNKLHGKTQVFQLALGNRNGELLFTAALDAENRVAISSDEAKSIRVQAQRFDDLCYPHDIPLLAKVDVEGYEMAVLEGMRETLQSNQLKAVIIELNGSGYRYDFDQEQIHQQLTDLGFQPFAYDPFTRELRPLERFGPHNTIYIRDLPFVRQRIRTAEKVEVNGVAF